MAKTLTILLAVLVTLSMAYPLAQAYTVHVIRLPLYYGRPPDTLAAAPAIDILGLSWKKTALTVQIVQASFVPSADYYTAVENAFSAWNQALANFGNQYGYPYLSQFSFGVSLVSAASTGYDITVEFTSATAVAGGEIGEALISYIGGTILSVKITLYLYVSGVGTLTPTDVYNIALHEIGHALGLNHAAQATTSNGPEVMYPYYNFPGYAFSPSTLDAYALAKVYAWLSTGVYTTVAAQTVYLPTTIPYEEISVSVAPTVPVYKVTVLSPVDLVVGAGLYPQGSTVTLRVTKTVVDLGNGTRLVFAGWVGTVNSTEPVITITVNGDVTERVVWKKQYLVNVPVTIGISCGKPGWYDPGSRVTFKVSKTIYTFSNGTRLVFAGWSGDVKSSATSITIEVDKPVTVYPVWRRQYLVEVETSYANANIKSEWVDAGKKIEIRLDHEVVDLGNGTRLVHTGWTGDVESSNLTLTVTVDKPHKVKPLWRREYLVKAESPYAPLTVKTGWYSQGKLLTVKPLKAVVDHGNGTMHVFAGWLDDGRRISGETLKLPVDRPHTVRALWRTQYRVTLGFKDAEGHTLNFTAVLAMGDETVIITPRNATSIWLGKGTWEIATLNYTSPELVSGLGSLLTGRKRVLVTETCTGDCGTIDVAKPGDHTIVLNIYNVTLVIEDKLGLPAPGLTVVIGERRYTSDLDGFLVQRLIDGGEHEAQIYIGDLKLGKAEVNVTGSGQVTVKTDLPVYPLADILVFAAAFAAARRLATK